MGNKILLADDSITIQKVIELTFSDEDFEVVTVSNGRLAIEKLEDVRPDVVLCDIIMPEKDGYEVCDYIKKHPTMASVPVLLLTGAFEPFDQERAARVGCDGFLAKPFEPSVLIGKVRDLLSRSSAPPRPAPTPEPQAAPPVAFPEEPPFESYEPVGEAEPESVGGDDDAVLAGMTAPHPEDVQETVGSPESLEGLYEDAGPGPEPMPEEFVPVTEAEAETLSAGASDDNASSTVAYRPSRMPWGDPTIEVPLEARARASAESQIPSPADLAPSSREAAETLPSERAFAPPVAPPEPPAPVESHPAWPVSELPAPDDRTAEASAPESETAADLVDSPVEASFADLGEAASGEPPAAPAHSEAASVSVPVEMVAQIAQRVVSQISEKVVREVAWEVIPDLAEAIIRKEIERLKAELQQS